MASIFGLAGLTASDYQFARQADQRLLYDAVRMYVDRINSEIVRVNPIFIQEQTEAVKERYQLPMGGRMNERSQSGGTRGVAVRRAGNWDVGYPMNDFDEQVAATDIEIAYMSPAEFDAHVEGVATRYVNEMRWRILHAMFDNVQASFADFKLGTVTVEPLANGDSVVYPPTLGSMTEATDNHYLESGYAASAISDTNNPYVTVVEELTEHFGRETGGRNIVTFINQAQRALTEDLTDFTPVPDNFILVGDNVDVPTRLPSVPGEIIGRTNGAWVVVWDWIPANYLLSVHLEAPAPCKLRVDPEGTGLPRGLAPVVKDDSHPIESMEWRARFGIAVGNRLNGVSMELGTGGTYTIPTAYD